TIETPTRLVGNDPNKRRAECRRWNDRKPEPRIERHVPRYVAKRRKRDPVEVLATRPVADGPDQTRAKAPASVVRMHIQLVEVRAAGLEDLDLCETDRSIIRERYP